VTRVMHPLSSSMACLLALGASLVIADGARAASGLKTEKRPGPAAALVCLGCHGANGEGAQAAKIPRLAGQSADYLDKQLRDYASGARSNEVMQNFAKPLSEADRAAVAVYFASLTASYAAPNLRATDSQLARGHQLAHQGSEPERVQACDNCHGPDGSGVPHSAPYLAGQSADYLAAELQSWREGKRKNDAGKLMSSVAQRLNDADVSAVSAYFASLGAL
jgi:thiosulfate dehydrogenase